MRKEKSIARYLINLSIISLNFVLQIYVNKLSKLSFLMRIDAFVLLWRNNEMPFIREMPLMF